MAIDSREKRQSVVSISQRHFGPSIVPNASGGEAERRAVGYSYYGITAGVAVAIGTVFRSVVIAGVLRR